MKRRSEIWSELKNKDACDVLILGGGVNGSSLLRELALQGTDCVLVDKGDFAAGASSKSSRMIHGGLRYLENAEFKLVAEAVKERNLLLKYAPHYVGPLRTTIPIMSWFAGLIKSPMVFLGLPVTPGGRGALVVKMGLTFYDIITGKRRQTPRHHLSSKAKSLADVPGLRDDISCTATYWDAWISQAERLCVDMIAEACRENEACTALNYVTVTKADDGSVLLKEQECGEATSIKPKIVVNATGAWVDYANNALGFDSQFMGGTKGSHLVVDNNELYDALGDRMIFYEHADGRVCITYRFMDKVIVGSTDLRVENPDDAACDDAEVDYMLTTLRGVFPQLQISTDDVVFTFCGVRPLPTSGLDYTSRVPRSHRIDIAKPSDSRPFPIYSLIGGKLTTFRAMAEQTADKVLPELGMSRKVSTEERYYPGATEFPTKEDEQEDWIQRVSKATNLDAARVKDLLLRYGTDAASLAAENGPWREPLKELPDFTVGEIQHIANAECVRHLVDIVRRRSIIALLGHAKEPALREMADIVGSLFDWDEETKNQEVAMALAEATGKA